MAARAISSALTEGFGPRPGGGRFVHAGFARASLRPAIRDPGNRDREFLIAQSPLPRWTICGQSIIVYIIHNYAEMKDDLATVLGGDPSRRGLSRGESGSAKD